MIAQALIIGCVLRVVFCGQMQLTRMKSIAITAWTTRGDATDANTSRLSVRQSLKRNMPIEELLAEQD